MASNKEKLISEDAATFLAWLICCGFLSAVAGFVVDQTWNNYRITLASVAACFVLTSRVINWPYKDFLALPAVEKIRGDEGFKPFKTTALRVNELEANLSVFRFFQACVYVKESKDAVMNAKSRELFTLILTLIVAAVVIGIAFSRTDNPRTPQTMANVDIGWSFTLGLLPIVAHALNLWLPLLLIQLRNQKL